MAAAANPFRRKQDAILGIDVSNHTSRPSSQALSRHDTFKSVGSRSTRNAGSIPADTPHLHREIPEADTDEDDSGTDRDNDSARFMDIRRETESLYSRGSRGSGDASARNTIPVSPDSENFDDEDDEDDDEYDSLDDDLSVYGGSMARRQSLATKRMRALRDGRVTSYTGSAALGRRLGSTEGKSANLPSKAERMLGMSNKPVMRTQSAALRPRTSRSEKGGMPSKAQKLLGVRADAIKPGQKPQPERESSRSGMTMNKLASEADEFRRMIMGGEKGFSFRKGKPDSNSDASSLSRSSLLESHTARSSKERLTPDADTMTWTAGSTAPAWMGIHPAFRNGQSSGDTGNGSPTSPRMFFPKDTCYSGKMVVSDFDVVDRKAMAINRAETFPVGAVELDAVHSPLTAVELPTPEHNFSTQSLPDVREAVQASSTSLSIDVADRLDVSRGRTTPDSSAKSYDGPPKKSARPSAIFENPFIFEMPADVPLSAKSLSTSTPKHTQGQQTPDTSDAAIQLLPKDADISSAHRDSPHPPKSPFPPPSRPLPQPPQKPLDSENLFYLPAVAYDGGHPRQRSEDIPTPPSSTASHTAVGSIDAGSNGQRDALVSPASGMSTPILNSRTVPSPLALALAEGNPVTINAPPPYPNADESTKTYAAEQLSQALRGVELSDKDLSRKQDRIAAQTIPEDEEHRPFSWQSIRTARNLSGNGSNVAPPMPPPLALHIPKEVNMKIAPSARGATIAATPLTATSARSRASRLEKALEAALSKEGMEKALSGERIEDLFRSAGADELFAFGIGPRVEGMTEEEDDADAQQAASRARVLLQDLSEIQKEVDQLRKLYAVGGPLEGQSPIG